MDGTDVSQVVDKIAEKLGVAVEKLQPLAEEVMRQYVVRESVYAVGCGLASIVGVFVFYKTLRYAQRHYDEFRRGDPDICIPSVLGGTTGLAIGLGFGSGLIIHIANALAPLPALLGI